MNRPKLCRLILGLSLSLLLIAGCTSSQHPVISVPILTPESPTLTPTLTTLPPTPTSIAPTPTPSFIAAPTINTVDAYNIIHENKDNPNFIIIDVRTVDEFNSGHIANSINMDYYSQDFKSIVGKLDRNRQYLVYCRTGIRGAAATQIMIDLGFKEVHNLSGGIVQWIQDGYTTVT